MHFHELPVNLMRIDRTFNTIHTNIEKLHEDISEDIITKEEKIQQKVI